MLTRGMLQFVRSEDELAYVLAKEMAHNILSHPARLRTQSVTGAIIDNLNHARPDPAAPNGTTAPKAMPQELDAAADSLSLYLLARAGYDIDNAPRFWQRLASQVPASVASGYTAMHPATAFRLSAMEKTLRQVKLKQVDKKTLSPAS